MNTALKIFILVCGLLFTVTIIRLLIKKRISESNSIIWLIGSFAILVLSLIPEVLQVIADIVGIDYPPSLLFLLSILLLLLIVFSQSVQISLLNDRVREMTQRIALLQVENELENKHSQKTAQ